MLGLVVHPATRLAAAHGVRRQCSGLADLERLPSRLHDLDQLAGSPSDSTTT